VNQIRKNGSDEQKQKYLPGIASGTRIGALALGERPGQVGIQGLATELRDGRLHGAKVPVLDGDCAHLSVVVAREGSGTSLALVELDGPGIERSAVRSLDPARSQARIRFDGARAERLGTAGQGAELLDRLFQRAAVLLAFEQLGGAQRCLEIAREFAMGRYAFGRPIASFQAIKHKLADMYASVELARSNCYYGAWALSTENAELPVAACLARISATQAFEHCARENLQIHGGVGFTWEYDCHLFLRRSRLLALQLGPPALWKDRLVSELDARTPA
jgi:alkylation response protein AidB-like acyl-CoA dehydrogenase